MNEQDVVEVADINAHVVAVAAHAAFERILNIECAANLRERFPGKRIGRGGRNHAETMRVEAAKPRDHLVGQSGAEVVLLGIAAEILERQDHQADFFRRQNPWADPAVDAIPGEAQNRCGSRGENGPLPFRRRRLDGKNIGFCIVAVLRTQQGVSNVRFGLEGGVGFGIVFGLALLDPVVQLARKGVNRGFFQVLVAIDGKPLAPLPALHGANFAA